MSISLGWLFFLAGILGSVKVLYAKSIADVSGYQEGRENRQEARAPMRMWVRLLVLALNLSVAIGGAVAISQKHNWNPFKPCPTCKLDGGPVS